MVVWHAGICSPSSFRGGVSWSSGHFLPFVCKLCKVEWLVLFLLGYCWRVAVVHARGLARLLGALPPSAMSTLKSFARGTQRSRPVIA